MYAVITRTGLEPAIIFLHIRYRHSKLHGHCNRLMRIVRVLKSGRSEWNGFVIGWKKRKLVQNFDGEVATWNTEMKMTGEYSYWLITD